MTTGPAAELDAVTADGSRDGRMENVRGWLGRGSAAVADQLLTSGANFALSILLARWVTAEDYGAYAVALAAFLLVATVFQGALLTPSLILGTTRYADRGPEYVAAMVRLHGKLGGLCAVLLGCAAAVYGLFTTQAELARCLAAMAVTAPAVLLWWLARSAWYLRLDPGPAAWGAFGYAVTLLGGVWLLRWQGWLSGETGILAMGMAGLATGLWLLWKLEPNWRGELTEAEVWRESWQFGKWEMGIALVAWLPASLCYPVTSAVLGQGEAGGLRALQNFALPVTQASTSVLRLLQPHVSGRFGADGKAPARLIWGLTAAVFGAAGLYLALVWFLRGPLMAIAYGGRFGLAVDLLPWVVLVAVLSAGTESVAMGLRAMRGSRGILVAFLVAGAVYLLTGVPAARALGLRGVVATLVVANTIAFAIVTWRFQSEVQRGNGR